MGGRGVGVGGADGGLTEEMLADRKKEICTNMQAEILLTPSIGRNK